MAQLEVRTDPDGRQRTFAASTIEHGALIQHDSTFMPIIVPSGQQPTEDQVQQAFDSLSSEDKNLFKKLSSPQMPDESTASDIHRAFCRIMNRGPCGEDFERLFILVGSSRFAHSCAPSAGFEKVRDDPEKKSGFYALKKIEKGEEITALKLPELLTKTTRERKDIMQQTGGFLTQPDCECAACTALPAEREASDMRRLLIGHLVKHFNELHKAGHAVNRLGLPGMLMAMLCEAEGILPKEIASGYMTGTATLMRLIRQESPLVVLQSLRLLTRCFETACATVDTEWNRGEFSVEKWRGVVQKSLALKPFGMAMNYIRAFPSVESDLLFAKEGSTHRVIHCTLERCRQFRKSRMSPELYLASLSETEKAAVLRVD